MQTVISVLLAVNSSAARTCFCNPRESASSRPRSRRSCRRTSEALARWLSRRSSSHYAGEHAGGSGRDLHNPGTLDLHQLLLLLLPDLFDLGDVGVGKLLELILCPSGLVL